MKILGIDASTSCVGWCLMNNDTGFSLGYIKLSGVKALNSKVSMTLAQLEGVLAPYKRDHEDVYIVLENYLKSFRKGHTSLQTVLLLAQFNALLQYVLPSIIGENKLIVMPVQTARKLAIGKIPKIKGSKWTSQKEYVQEWFFENIGYDFEKKKRVDKPIDEHKDMIDSWVLSKAGFMTLHKGQ